MAGSVGQMPVCGLGVGSVDEPLAKPRELSLARGSRTTASGMTLATLALARSEARWLIETVAAKALSVRYCRVTRAPERRRPRTTGAR